jgi:hypothetical protein
MQRAPLYGPRSGYFTRLDLHESWTSAETAGSCFAAPQSGYAWKLMIARIYSPVRYGKLDEIVRKVRKSGK